jgi:hypothetical protein
MRAESFLDDTASTWLGMSGHQSLTNREATAMNVYALAVGVASAVVVVLLFKAWGLEATKWAYPLLLATFPANYWVFAIYGSDSPALLKEMVTGVAFLAVAYIAYKVRSFVTLMLLAFGYVMHAAYDSSHNLLFVNAGAPTWWPEFCGSVDVLLGAYIAYLAFSFRKQSAVR